MPCNTITLQTIVLTKALSNLVEEALKNMGYSIVLSKKDIIQAVNRSTGGSIQWKAGVGVTVKSYNASKGQEEAQNLNRAYSVQAVQWAAKKAGWLVTRTSSNQFTMTKR